MTVSSGFFNSVNHDRLYDAEQLSSIFDGIILDGVYENVGEAFNVTAYPDAYNTVLVGTGRAWFNHTWTLNDSRFSITLDPPNEMLGRIDAIVIDVNKERDTRKNSIIYLKGDEATPDFPPTLINTENHHQYPIAYITRHAEQNGPISQSDIEITVGTGACPIVTGVLEAQNLENLMQQLDAEFNEWWDGIKDVLDENTVTNLQNQINEIKEKLDSDTALVGLLEKPIAEAFMSGDYGLNIKSYNVTIPYPMYSFQYPVTFLPDGKVLSTGIGVTREDLYGGSVLYTPEIRTYIVGTDGVSNEHVIDVARYMTYASDTYSSSKCSGTWLDGSFGSYPVKFSYIMFSADGSTQNETVVNGKFTIATVEISSSGTYRETYTDTKTIRLFSDLNNYDTSMGMIWTVNSTKLSDGSTIVVNFVNLTKQNDSSKYGTVVVTRITSDGVIGDQKITDISTPSGDPNATFFARNRNILVIWTPTTDGKIIAYLNKHPGSSSGYDVVSDYGDRLIVDPETLETQVVVGSGTEGDYPAPDSFPYDVYQDVSTYSVSEQNGVTATTIAAGKPPEKTQVKISPYFTGATNLGSAIPEGTYLAMKDSLNCLYGIVGSGNQVAIGSNGGAAILKASKSVNQSLNINNAALWSKSYYEGDNYSAYLFVDGIFDDKTIGRVYSYPYYANPVSVYQASGSVIRISKGA